MAASMLVSNQAISVYTSKVGTLHVMGTAAIDKTHNLVTFIDTDLYLIAALGVLGCGLAESGRAHISALGGSDGALFGLGSQFQTVSLADVLDLVFRCQFGAGLLGVGLQYLVDFLATVHVFAQCVNTYDDVSVK